MKRTASGAIRGGHAASWNGGTTELDALDPVILQEPVRDSIEGLIDEAGLVIVAAVADLHAPWDQPDWPVELIEEPLAGFPGWSLYRLEDGKAAAGSETPNAKWTEEFLLGALVRAVADVTRVCPACTARARVAAAGEDGLSRGVMEHEAACPVADDGMLAAAGRGERVGPLPAGPRTWEVWAQRLRRGYRPRRAFG